MNTTKYTHVPFRVGALALALSLAGPVFAAPQDHGRGHGQEHRDDAVQADDQAADRAKAARAHADALHQEAAARNAAVREQAHARDRDEAARAAAQARQDAIDRGQAMREAERRAADRREADARHADQERREEAMRRQDAERQQAAREAQRRAEDARRDDAARRAADARRDDAARRAADARRDEEARRAAALHQQEELRERQARERDRISDMERQRRIAEQQRQLADYRRQIAQHEALERQRALALQQARRTQAWRYQQAYWERRRAMQSAWLSNYRYDNDPYYWAPATYRYGRAGRDYMVTSYAADLLRQAVRYGYDQGVRAGEADRFDGWRNNYRDNFAYQDAGYGYNGYYVSPDEYSYYFRQGFQRGYEDGYGRAARYGRYDNGNYSILANVLQAILNLQPLG